ncbi:MAG: class I tRNA ligase family protein, partial [Oscillospiraceae bacterium]
AGSSWYFLRYCDPHNSEALASRKALEYWTPIDWYNGGMEHTTLHLLYSRFWHKFLYDIGVVPTSEPYSKRTSHGMILGEGGDKMSKSRGNVVNPDEIVAQYGADTLRLYEMFVGDFEKAAPWSSDSIRGCKRFLDRVFALLKMATDEEKISQSLECSFNRTIKKVGNDIETLRFNTAIAAMMALLNEIYEKKSITRKELQVLLLILNPFAPHLTEEMWQLAGFKSQIAHTKWPAYDEAKCVEAMTEIAVQINGKLRGRVMISTDSDEKTALETAHFDDKIAAELAGKTIVKEIYVKGKIINIVAK